MVTWMGGSFTGSQDTVVVILDLIGARLWTLVILKKCRNTHDTLIRWDSSLGGEVENRD